MIGYAFDDDEFLVLAVDASGTWIKVATVGGEAWIAVSVGELDDDCHGLAITGDPFKDDDDDDGDDDDDDDGDDDHDDGDHDDGDHDDGDDDHDDDDDDDDDGDGDDDHDDDDD